MKKLNLKKALISVLKATIVMVIFYEFLIIFVNNAVDTRLDDRTKELCWVYAHADHKLEIGEERFKWLSQWGDPNDPEFFYESCIGHITGKPAEKEYLK